MQGDRSVIDLLNEVLIRQIGEAHYPAPQIRS